MIFPSCQICFHLPITFSTWAGCLGYHRGWNPTQLWWGLKQKMMNHDKDPGLNNRYSWKQPGLRFFFSNFVAHLRNRRSNPTVSGWPLGINVFSAPFRMLKRDQAPAARVTRFTGSPFNSQAFQRIPTNTPLKTNQCLLKNLVAMKKVHKMVSVISHVVKWMWQ